MLEREYNDTSKPEDSGGGDRDPSQSSKEIFHDELELKLLVIKKPGQKFHTRKDISIFTQIESDLKSRGWVRIPKRTSHLLTRQFDTPDADIIKNTGQTLRLRATCLGNNLKRLQHADICVKLEKQVQPSGAVKRAEFEDQTPNFRTVDFEVLRKKYPDTTPKHHTLHEFLDSVDEDNLIEFFRIDCKRSRLVVELGEAETGIAGKRFCAEILLDDVAHVIDIRSDGKTSEESKGSVVSDYPFVFNHDLEIEAEVLYQPCEYDTSKNAADFVTSPDMSPKEIDHCMYVLKKTLISAANNRVKVNTLSKGERGFIGLGILQEPQSLPQKTISSAKLLIDAFRASSKGWLVPENDNVLPQNPKIDIIGYRGIALKK